MARTMVSKRLPAAVALCAGMCLSAQSFGAFQVTETFDTDPGWLREGGANGVDGHNFGFAPASNETGLVAPPVGPVTGPGEAGGNLGRGSPASYGDDIGTLTLNDDLRVDGVLRFPNTGEQMLFGWYNSAVTGGGDGRRPHLLGLRQVARGGDAHHVQIYLGTPTAVPGDDRQIERLAFDGENAARKVTNGNAYPFTILYDADGGTSNFGSITLFIDGADSRDGAGDESFTVDLTEAQRMSGLTFDRFGMTSGPTSGEGSQVAFFDDLTYTSNVPEPATLGLVAMGGLLTLRRRR